MKSAVVSLSFLTEDFVISVNLSSDLNLGCPVEVCSKNSKVHFPQEASKWPKDKVLDL